MTRHMNLELLEIIKLDLQHKFYYFISESNQEIEKAKGKIDTIIDQIQF